MRLSPAGRARCGRGSRARRARCRPGASASLAERAGQLCAGNLMLMTVGSCSSPGRARQIKALGLVPEESDRCSLPLLCFPAFILLANACHIFAARGNRRRVPRLNRRGAARSPRSVPGRAPLLLRVPPGSSRRRKPFGFSDAEVFLAAATPGPVPGATRAGPV